MIYELQINGLVETTVDIKQAQELAFKHTPNFNLFMVARDQIKAGIKKITLLEWVLLVQPEYL